MTKKAPEKGRQRIQSDKRARVHFLIYYLMQTFRLNDLVVSRTIALGPHRFAFLSREIVFGFLFSSFIFRVYIINSINVVKHEYMLTQMPTIQTYRKNYLVALKRKKEIRTDVEIHKFVSLYTSHIPTRSFVDNAVVVWINLAALACARDVRWDTIAVIFNNMKVKHGTN